MRLEAKDSQMRAEGLGQGKGEKEAEMRYLVLGNWMESLGRTQKLMAKDKY